jgi:hypothetical protein
MHVKRNRSSSRSVAALFAAALCSSACTIHLKPVDLQPPAQKRADALRAAATADGIDGMVGWGRITLFYIPAVPVFIVDDTHPSRANTRAQIANREVMKQVRRALEHVGYQVESVDTATGWSGRLLTCHVEEFWFNNYTWLAPFVPTWGNAKITVAIEGPAGARHWARTFQGDGWSANFFDGYDAAANEAMEKVLNGMVIAFASDEFQLALSAVDAPAAQPPADPGAVR